MKWVMGAAAAALLYAGCANAGVIQGTTGAYMSPFTSDGVTSGWVTKSMSVKASGQIGAVAGSYAAQKLLENVPFASMFGSKAGQMVGRQIALKSIGGEEYLKSSSDQSFSNLQDMAQYIKDNYSDRKDIGKIMEAVYAIYPDLQPVYDATGALVKVGKTVEGAGAPNAQGVVSDIYRISIDHPQAIKVGYTSTEMSPLITVVHLPDSKLVASFKAEKGATVGALNAQLTAPGDYQTNVQPVPKMFGQGKGGAYKLMLEAPDAGLTPVAAH